MILVEGEPLQKEEYGDFHDWKLLTGLLRRPSVMAAAEAFRRTSMRHFTTPAEEEADIDAPSSLSSQGERLVYVFQRERATVCPERVSVVGTDEMTTCIALAIRDPTTGRTSVGHLDGPDCVEQGVSGMLASLEADPNTILELHIVGAYDDSQEELLASEDGGIDPTPIHDDDDEDDDEDNDEEDDDMASFLTRLSSDRNRGLYQTPPRASPSSGDLGLGSERREGGGLLSGARFGAGSSRGEGRLGGGGAEFPNVVLGENEQGHWPATPEVKQKGPMASRADDSAEGDGIESSAFKEDLKGKGQMVCNSTSRTSLAEDSSGLVVAQSQADMGKRLLLELAAGGEGKSGEGGGGGGLGGGQREDDRWREETEDEGKAAALSGHSWPLATMLVGDLERRAQRFELRTLCVLDHNTETPIPGEAFPVVRGLAIETRTGGAFPAQFSPASRGPDGVVRGVCVTAGHKDDRWQRTLVAPYDTHADVFRIGPCRYAEMATVAQQMLAMPDEALLSLTSTSPAVEGPDFLPASRITLAYLRDFPNWRHTFPGNKPRIFVRTPNGTWRRQQQTQHQHEATSSGNSLDTPHNPHRLSLHTSPTSPSNSADPKEASPGPAILTAHEQGIRRRDADVATPSSSNLMRTADEIGGPPGVQRLVEDEAEANAAGFSLLGARQRAEDDWRGDEKHRRLSR